jgi:trans-aconitate 2-methyltransferase
MRELAKTGTWANRSSLAEAARADLPSPEAYYDLLKALCRNVEIWHTIYNHVLAVPSAIVE